MRVFLQPILSRTCFGKTASHQKRADFVQSQDAAPQAYSMSGKVPQRRFLRKSRLLWRVFSCVRRPKGGSFFVTCCVCRSTARPTTCGPPFRWRLRRGWPLPLPDGPPRPLRPDGWLPPPDAGRFPAASCRTDPPQRGWSAYRRRPSAVGVVRERQVRPSARAVRVRTAGQAVPRERLSPALGGGSAAAHGSGLRRYGRGGAAGADGHRHTRCSRNRHIRRPSGRYGPAGSPPAAE